jgi:hypothetical protein
MRVLDDNGTNWLVQKDDGSTETKTKASNLNQLLYGHNLWGLIDEGSEIWTGGGDGEPKVTVVPDDDATCYTIDPEGMPLLQLGAHHKTRLVDAFMEIYDDHEGNTVQPLLDLYESIRDDMARADVLDPFATLLENKVEIREGGWWINGHLLLTYEGDFYHANHVSRNRSGGVVGEGTAVEAYQHAVPEPDADMNRSVTVEGEEYRLTNSEVEFVTKAVWAVKATPDRRNQ